MRAWLAVCCASTSGRPPESARPWPCSRRPTVGPSAAPTSSSAIVETHGRAYTDGQLDGLEVVPPPGSSTAARPSRRWTSTPSCDGRPMSPSSTSSPTPTPPARATPSGGRTSRSCSTPASTSSRPSTSSTSSRSTTSSSRSPASSSARPSPTTSCARGRPGRARRHVARVAAATDGPRQHLRRRQDRRRAVELLPAGQPLRAARARAAVARRPGRRDPRALPRLARHLRVVADARACRRRPHRRPRGRDPAAAGRPDRLAGRRGRAARLPRRPERRARRRQRRAHRRPARGSSRSSAAPSTPSPATTSGEAILDFARGVNATQIVVGHLAPRRRPGVPLPGHRRVGRRRGGRHRRPPRRARLRRLDDPATATGDLLSRRRRIGGWLLAVLGILAVTLVLVPSRESHDLPLEVLVYLALTVGCALLGGVWPAVPVRGRLVARHQLVLHRADRHARPSTAPRTPWRCSSSSSSGSPSRRSCTSRPAAARQAIEAQHESRTLATLAQSLLGVADPVTGCSSRP